jgi:thioredoxin-related protein
MTKLLSIGLFIILIVGCDSKSRPEKLNTDNLIGDDVSFEKDTLNKVGFIKNLSLKEAKNYAKNDNRRLLIYYNGHGCVNCRELEYYVFSDSLVETINERLISVTYYVDESSDKEFKELKIQKKTFNRDDQPYFAILDKDGKVLSEIGKTEDPEEFKDFLKQGLK